MNCEDCLLPMDWCPGCGMCACWCECWMTRTLPRLRDPRYDLLNDERFQRTQGRLIDTIKPEEAYL